MSKTYSTTIEITEEKEYPVTISAGLDLSEWITAGSTTEYPLNPSSYADFAALEADEEAIRQLMLVHASVDYLATASADDSLMESIISSDICAKWINLSDYALDTLSANASIKAIMDEVDKYGYGELGLVGQVPTMTSNTSPKGECIGATPSSETNDKWKAFDGYTGSDIQHGYISPLDSTPCWVGYHFPVVDKIDKAIVTLRVRYQTTADVLFKLQGSNDASFSNPQDLGSFTLAANSGTGVKTFDVDLLATSNYAYHRIYTDVAISQYGGREIYIQLQYYAYEPLGNVPIMTANNAPYGVVSVSNEYIPAWHAFDGDITDNTTWHTNTSFGSEVWIQYQSVNPICAKRMSINWDSRITSAKCKLVGSNDGTNWEDILSYTTLSVSNNKNVVNIPDNNAYYLYHRLYIKEQTSSSSVSYAGQISYLQFYGRELTPLVPTMTGNDNRIITDGYYKEVYPSAADNLPYMAFDGNNSNISYWLSKPGPSDRYIGWNFGKATDIKYFALCGLIYGLSYPMYLMGSNDGENWETIYTIPTGTGGVAAGTWVRDEVDANYKMYKVQTYIANSSGQRYVIDVTTLQFYGSDYSEKEFAQGSTRKTIYDHGVAPSGIHLIAGSTGGTPVDDGNQITVTSPNSAALSNYSLIQSNEAVNMGDYDYIHVRYGTRFVYDSSNKFHLGAWKTKMTGQNYANSNIDLNIDLMTVIPLTALEDILDITQVNDTEYPAYYASYTRAVITASIKELWLE